MIKVSLFFPHDPEKRFDLDYYLNSHMPMVNRLLGPMGLQGDSVDKGVSAPDPKQPPPFVVVGHLLFNSVDEVHQAFITHGSEIMSDLKNYTDIIPQIQISEVAS